MRADRLSRIVALAAAIATASLSGCAPRSGPPPIAKGGGCAVCGMGIEDLRFACERPAEGRWRSYDSIECLLREARASDRAWLADYDSRTLHAADSVWVVQGEFPSPMGGGFAAFLDSASANEIAGRTHGRVDRFAAFVSTGSPVTSR